MCLFEIWYMGSLMEKCVYGEILQAGQLDVRFSTLNSYQSVLIIYTVETGGNSGRECKAGAGLGSTAPKTSGLTTRF
jgi:hypothetical protein